MSNRIVGLVGIVLVLALGVSGESSAADFEQKKVVGIQSSIPGYNCFLFLLEGVSNPTGAPSNWFAMHRDQIGARDAFAIILAAKAAGDRISVRTTSLGCGGYVIADFVWQSP